MEKPPATVPKCPDRCPPDAAFETAYAFPCKGVFAAVCWGVGFPIFKWRVHDHQEAENETQEAWLFAAAHWPIASRPDLTIEKRQVWFRAWFTSVCHYRGRDAVKAYARKMFNKDGSRRIVSLAEASAANEHPSGELPVLECLAGAEHDSPFLVALKSLPEEQAVPLLLRHVHGVPANLIADLCEVSTSIIYRRMREGIATMRGMFPTAVVPSRTVAHS